MPLGKLAREHLESELLLSKGGGIYYDNARVDANENEATLFIGLGGTGADMLIRIKNEVKRRMVLPQTNGKIVSDTPNNIGFLAIDTDMDSMRKTWGTATFDQFGAEFCSIAVDDKQAIVVKWKKLADANADEARWYDRIDAVGALPGAGGIRQIGRLLLFENIRNVKDRLQSKIRELIAGGINKVNIIVVAGIAGGTGSGTFIDIAYIARSVLEELSVPGRNVFGYIILPDVNLLNGGEEDALKRNGFAALKELDYWMSPGEDEQHDRFAQNYGSVTVGRSQPSKVFDFCHLLSAQDMNGVPLTYNKVISSMAENVFAYIAGEVSATSDSSGNSALRGMYDNIDGYITGLSASAPIPACYRYLAVGSHKLEIPYEEISTLLAIRLFEKLKPTFDLRPTEDTFKTDMRRLQLVPKEVIHDSLTRNLPASPLDGNPNYQHGQIWGAENTGPKTNRPFSDVYQWMAREFQTAVTESVKNWANAQNGIFRNFINDNMKKTDRGPMYLSALVKSDNEWSMIPTLNRMAEQCDAIAATCLSNQGEIEAKLLSSYNAGHGKILNKGKYVADYLSALNEWMFNEMGIYVYPQRAEAIREFCDKLQLYYDKVFSKLADVLEALPEIFRQNFDYISIAQREAEQEGKLDETKLIWPLKYEQENRADFNRMLEEGIVGFLDSMTTSLGRWTGCDLDTLDATSAGTDVPGFISNFVSEQFGGLLNINMEQIMRSKEGADNLEPYLRRVLLNLKEKSVPMFSMNQAYRNTSTAEFGLVSVPQDCLEITAAARNFITSDRVNLKTSKEKTRIYFVKIISGIPLYAYSKVEDMESVYEEAKGKLTGKGMHLNGLWLNDYPTPLHQTAWSPAVYENPAVKKYNDGVREAFDFCVKNEVIRPDNPESPTRLLLYIAENADAASIELGDHLTMAEQLDVLKSEKETFWGGNSIELMGMGAIGGGDLIENVRESILRIPRICNEIKRQAEIVTSFDQRMKGLEDPRYFANALISGLVTKQGFKIVYKRSLDAVQSELLYDITLEKPFGEYDAYMAFKAKLDDNRRREVDIMLREMLDRIGEGGSEKDAVVGRVENIAQTYTKKLPELKTRIERAAMDKRKPIQDMFAFYNAVLEIAVRYRDMYLV